MIRKQLYITAGLDRGLKRLAAATGESEAEHVRTALRRYLDRELETEEDPLGSLVGMVDVADGPTDVAERHDKYLYEAAESPGRYEA